MDQKELEILIAELESRVDRLRGLYEQYFMGIERLVPAVPHKDVERRLYVLRREQIRNTALRFRFQNILLKYNTYQTYWIRITRQIEEGTYKRDVRRANARFANPEKGVSPERAGPAALADDPEGVDVEIELDLDAEVASFEDDELARAREDTARVRAAMRSERPARSPTPVPPPAPRPPSRSGLELDAPFGAPPSSPREVARARRPSGRPDSSPPIKRQSSRPAIPNKPPVPAPPPVSAARLPTPKAAPRPRSAPPPSPPPRPVAKPPTLSDARVRQIYTQYVETKRKVGESTAAITFESLSRSLRESSEKLREKHGGKSVDFEVTVKGGKAVLRPVVK